MTDTALNNHKKYFIYEVEKISEIKDFFIKISKEHEEYQKISQDVTQIEKKYYKMLEEIYNEVKNATKKTVDEQKMDKFYKEKLKNLEQINDFLEKNFQDLFKKKLKLTDEEIKYLINKKYIKTNKIEMNKILAYIKKNKKSKKAEIYYNLKKKENIEFEKYYRYLFNKSKKNEFLNIIGIKKNNFIKFQK